jgi:transcriptional regulator GlxA family with amidase domain
MRYPTQPGAWLDTARTLLDGSCDAPLPLRQLAARLGVSRYHLMRPFRRAWGVTPHQYRTVARICSSPASSAAQAQEGGLRL